MRTFSYLFLCAFVFSQMACDQAGTSPNLNTKPPIVSDLSYLPAGANLASLPSSQIVGDNVKIPIVLSIRLTDGDNTGIKQVVYSIFAPQNTSKAVVTGNLTSSTSGVYQATATLDVPKGNIGKYTIKAFAIDKDDNVSNQVIGYFEYGASGQPPVLASVDVPATIKRPTGSDRVTAKFVATVTDPDGISNIQRVVMKTASGQELLLLDDGQKNGTSGDDVADDGKFTLTVQITAANALGVNVFTFQAFDRSGLVSNIITKSVEVIQ